MTVRRSDGLSDPALRAAALHDAVGIGADQFDVACGTGGEPLTVVFGRLDRVVDRAGDVED